MLKNIEFTEINKAKVMKSTLFVPLAAPLFLIFLTLFRDGTIDHFQFGEFIGVILISFLYGAIFWIPTVLFILLLEYLIIRKAANETTVGMTLLLEAIIAFIVIWGLFGFSFNLNAELPFALGLSIILPQIFRWMFLKYKGRMFNAAKTQSILDKN